eukprot:m.21324 g.21324  ORF g.21324 m.21324 type:complete len:67 (-) comp12390_c0_seq1:117-317(-)
MFYCVAYYVAHCFNASVYRAHDDTILSIVVPVVNIVHRHNVIAQTTQTTPAHTHAHKHIVTLDSRH